MTLIQILLAGFGLFALTRVLGRYLARKASLLESLFWAVVWSALCVLALVPAISQVFANILGVGRGVDAVFYFGFVGVAYGFFRLHLTIRRLESQMTSVVRAIALERAVEPSDGASAQSPRV